MTHSEVKPSISIPPIFISPKQFDVGSKTKLDCCGKDYQDSNLRNESGEGNQSVPMPLSFIHSIVSPEKNMSSVKDGGIGSGDEDNRTIKGKYSIPIPLKFLHSMISTQSNNTNIIKNDNVVVTETSELSKVNNGL